jgi:hypothetical protein
MAGGDDVSHMRTTDEIEAWFHERVERHEARQQEAWVEYLETTRRCPEHVYLQAEPLAWRRLRRRLAELAHDRRRDAFARDRALADAGADGFRLAG